MKHFLPTFCFTNERLIIEPSLSNKTRASLLKEAITSEMSTPHVVILAVIHTKRSIGSICLMFDTTLFDRLAAQRFE